MGVKQALFHLETLYVAVSLQEAFWRAGGIKMAIA